jgi:transcriptional regulator with XRE-family HTH domain
MKGRTSAQRIGDALRKRRESLGVSQERYADLINVHRTYYSGIERGEHNLTMKSIEKVCEGMKVHVWEVLRDADV